MSLRIVCCFIFMLLLFFFCFISLSLGFENFHFPLNIFRVDFCIKLFMPVLFGVFYTVLLLQTIQLRCCLSLSGTCGSVVLLFQRSYSLSAAHAALILLAIALKLFGRTLCMVKLLHLLLLLSRSHAQLLSACLNTQKNIAQKALCCANNFTLSLLPFAMLFFSSFFVFFSYIFC